VNRRTSLSYAAIVAAVGGVILAGGATAFAAERVTVASRAPLTLAQVRGSVNYLTSAYNITEAEALRRLELQRTSAELNTALAKHFPDQYAGFWLDQNAGGRLVVAATEPGRVTSSLAGVPDHAHITVTRAERSLRQLTTVRARLDKKINTSPDPKVRAAEVVVDVRANVVAVYQHSAQDTASTSPGTDVAQAERQLPFGVYSAVAAATAGE
jgi:streptogrisin C